MQNNLLLVPLIVGPVFIIAGFILYKFPPKKINGIYGYRTPGSMSSQDRWDFAQTYSGKEMAKIGVFLTLLSFVGLALNINDAAATFVGVGLMIGMVILLFIRVEKALKKQFGGK